MTNTFVFRARMLNSQKEWIASIERLAGSHPESAMSILKVSTYTDLVKRIANLKFQTDQLAKDIASADQEENDEFNKSKSQSL